MKGKLALFFLLFFLSAAIARPIEDYNANKITFIMPEQINAICSDSNQDKNYCQALRNEYFLRNYGETEKEMKDSTMVALAIPALALVALGVGIAIYKIGKNRPV